MFSNAVPMNLALEQASSRSIFR